VGLPATLKIPGRDEDLTITPGDAKYVQELAWKVYRREIKNTKPSQYEASSSREKWRHAVTAGHVRLAHDLEVRSSGGDS
jgi:hypothetical protein